MGIELQILMFIGSTLQQRNQNRKLEKEKDARKGQKFSVSGEAAPLPVVYGKQTVGGIKTFHKTRSNYQSVPLVNAANPDDIFSKNFGTSTQSGSNKNEFLVVQTALCYEGIEGVQNILVDSIDYKGSTGEQKENKAEFQHRFHIRNTGGTADATAVANGVSSTNLFTKAANSTSFFKLNRDNPQYNGSPNVQYLIKGRKIKKITRSGTDPNFSYSLNTSYEYSNNPSYCLLDYLLNEDFGRGLETNEVDLESFYNAAEICDITVFADATIAGSVNATKPIFAYTTYNDFPELSGLQPYQTLHLFYDESANSGNGQLYEVTGTPGNYNYNTISGPNTESLKLYECNITLDTTAKLRDNIESILLTMGGADLLWTPEGKYKLSLSYPRTANEVETDLIDINHEFEEDDIVRKDLNISWPSAQDKFTQVTVTFLNEFEEFNEDSVTWPANTDSVYTGYLSEDNNLPLTTTIEGLGVTSPYHAKALAEYTVRRSRNIFTVEVTLSKKALTVEPGDIIKINSSNANLNNEIIKVESVKINSDFTVNIKGYCFKFSYLAWNISDHEPYPIQLENNFIIEAPTTFQFNSSNSLLGTSSGKLTWDSVDDNSIREYVVEVRPSNSSTYTELGRTQGNEFDIAGLLSNNYIFSVRSRSITGRMSERVETNSTSISLKTVGRIKPVYADDANGTNKTITLTNQQFVLYYEYDGDFDINDVTGTWVKFIGLDGPAATYGNAEYVSVSTIAKDGDGNYSTSQPLKIDVDFREGDTIVASRRYSVQRQSGADTWNTTIGTHDTEQTPVNASRITPSIEVEGVNAVLTVTYSHNSIVSKVTAPFNIIISGEGSPGADGVRGPGWWRYVDSTNAVSYYSTDTQNRVTAAWNALHAPDIDPVKDDRLIISCTDDALAYLYDGTSTWDLQDAFIDGSLVVAGELSALSANAGTITAGVLRSQDQLFQIDLTTKRITIST
jgi:hypothetical protein